VRAIRIGQSGSSLRANQGLRPALALKDEPHGNHQDDGREQRGGSKR
jgi:hypothetical protein